MRVCWWVCSLSLSLLCSTPPSIRHNGGKFPISSDVMQERRSTQHRKDFFAVSGRVKRNGLAPNGPFLGITERYAWPYRKRAVPFHGTDCVVIAGERFVTRNGTLHFLIRTCFKREREIILYKTVLCRHIIRCGCVSGDGCAKK